MATTPSDAVALEPAETKKSSYGSIAATKTTTTTTKWNNATENERTTRATNVTDHAAAGGGATTPLSSTLSSSETRPLVTSLFPSSLGQVVEGGEEQQQQPASAAAASNGGNDGGDDDNGDIDEYIISLIRRDSKLKNQNDGEAHSIVDDDDDDVSASSAGDGSGEGGDHNATTYWQTVTHLVKGYIGCGILSLPWAVSQLGIPLGVAAILTMSLWSSYNCWTVVRLKRYMERNEGLFNRDVGADDEDDVEDDDDGVASSHRGGSKTGYRSLASRVSSVSSRASSNITYPDVGEWAHGVDFQSYVSFCICTQQLAICTVFLSFIGENLYAVLQFLNVTALQNHEAVISAALPAVLMLSFIPSLKQLTPVMMAGTVLIFSGFASLGVIAGIEWENRPPSEDWPTLNFFKAPMALCGILYSFEGICIILPVESAMQEPRKFLSAFTLSMLIVSGLLVVMAVMPVVAFGPIDNGSITAFLLQEYGHDDRLKLLLNVSNLCVSVSIILTYPLQLFPAVQLIGPMVQKEKRRHDREGTCGWGGGVAGSGGDGADNESMGSSHDDEHDLNGFEPLGGIPEHSVASLGSLPSQHHDYGTAAALADEGAINAAAAAAAAGGVVDPSNKRDEGGGGVSISRLSSMGHSVAGFLTPQMQLPGDSPLLRTCLVLGTYAVALVVPNVEALVSLAGAVAGSSTALLIPPILELAFIRHMEQKDAQRELSNHPGIGSGGVGANGNPLPDWEGGPSEASKSTLLKTSGVADGTTVEAAAFRTLTTPTTQQQEYQKRRHHRKKKHRHKYLLGKIVAWLLLILGSIFAAIGSYFSVENIVKIYLPSDTDE